MCNMYFWMCYCYGKPWIVYLYDCSTNAFYSLILVQINTGNCHDIFNPLQSEESPNRYFFLAGLLVSINMIKRGG